MQAKSIVVVTYPECAGYTNAKSNLSPQHTGQSFKEDPAKVNTFYNKLRQSILQQHPSPTHRAIANFESHCTVSGSSLTIITSSTDNLHQRAGNQNIIHTHGELMKARCTRTLNIIAWPRDITPTTPCPCCNRFGTLRPHIVWPDEIPFCLFDTEDALAACDLLIAINPYNRPKQLDQSLNFAKKVSGQKIIIGNQMIDGFDLQIKDANEHITTKLLDNLNNQAA